MNRSCAAMHSVTGNSLHSNESQTPLCTSKRSAAQKQSGDALRRRTHANRIRPESTPLAF
jgi:hypothetical protein